MGRNTKEGKKQGGEKKGNPPNFWGFFLSPDHKNYDRINRKKRKTGEGGRGKRFRMNRRAGTAPRTVQ